MGDMIWMGLGMLVLIGAIPAVILYDVFKHKNEGS